MIYIILVLCGVAGACIILRSRYEVKHFKVKEYNFVTDKITEEIKIGFITDLHNCLYGKDNKSVIEAFEKHKCSFLIIGGDLLVGKRNIGDTNPYDYCGNSAALLNGLMGKMPVYYTFGNHETRVKNRRKENPLYDAYMGMIKNPDIEFLNNKTRIWKNDGNTLIITGLEIDEEAYDRRDSFKINNSLFGEGKEGYRILIAHSPEFFDEYAKENIDLVLCGHNHGGTVRLPFIGGVVSRDYKLFPKYSYGVYEKNHKKMLVTSGIGDHTIHFRLFNMPEAVIITLVPEKGLGKNKEIC